MLDVMHHQQVVSVGTQHIDTEYKKHKQIILSLSSIKERKKKEKRKKNDKNTLIFHFGIYKDNNNNNNNKLRRYNIKYPRIVCVTGELSFVISTVDGF